MMNRLFFFLLCFSVSIVLSAQSITSYTLSSPGQQLQVNISVGESISWSLKDQEQTIIEPSTISLQLAGGKTLGTNPGKPKQQTRSVNTSFEAINYRKQTVQDHYNELTLDFKKDFNLVFRAYDDGIAYRFVLKQKDSVFVSSEQAEFNFDKDYQGWFPYVQDPRQKGDNFNTSFENVYNEIPISKFAKDTLAFLPVLIALDNNKKALITEANLEHYPGMYLDLNRAVSHGLHGVYPKYPLETRRGPGNSINSLVYKRADYIAKLAPGDALPWRTVVVSDNDAQLANNDMVQRLATPNRLTDISWIKPGKVAWDWWNDWNITHVDFRAGINTPTYKYYIDFAAANKLEYIIIDEGWSNDLDLMDLSKEIDLKAIIDYGKSKNVGVMLWATWIAIDKQMDQVFPHYAAMGVKGFKIDFLDRDDQQMTSSTYRIAAKAAENHLLVDLHGMYKPEGLQRTYPNVVNFEGVRGLENVKWAPHDDVPRYDVTLPFIRQAAGMMDYTPGAMRNATKANYVPSNSMPMSQGTRCHQIAMYVVFDAPLQMLADNPTAYMHEQESTDFIAAIPTTFDQTVGLQGKVSEYLALAKRKGDTWYVGAMTNWDARDMTLDLSFLGEGNYEATIMRDGINADRNATDYKKEVTEVTSKDKLSLHLAPGGGWAAIIRKK